MERPRELLLPGALTLALLGGCATGGIDRGDATGASSVPTSVSIDTPPSTLQSSSTTNPDTRALFKFDYQGVGSTIIETYVGPGELAADRVANGTFNHDEIRPLDCHITGRSVPIPKKPEDTVGRSSKDWYRLIGVPVRYATGAFGAPVDNGAPIKEC